MNSGFTAIDATWYASNVTSLTEIPVDPYKTSNRYEGKTLISDIKGQHMQFIQRRWFPSTDSEDQLVYVDAKYAYRPDIISVDYYNSPLYAWAILAANGLRSIWQVEAGMYLKMPNIAKISGGLK